MTSLVTNYIQRRNFTRAMIRKKKLAVRIIILVAVVILCGMGAFLMIRKKTVIPEEKAALEKQEVPVQCRQARGTRQRL